MQLFVSNKGFKSWVASNAPPPSPSVNRVEKNYNLTITSNYNSDPVLFGRRMWFEVNFFGRG